MVSHHALEKTIYKLVRDRPCTRIHGRPTYQHFCTLSRKCQEAAFEFDTGYLWFADLGLSPLIVGAAAHLRDTSKTFTEPIQPPNVDTRIVAGITVAEWAKYTAGNDKLREWFAMVKGFRSGSTKNIRDALDEAYYRQLKHVRFGSRRVTPCANWTRPPSRKRRRPSGRHGGKTSTSRSSGQDWRETRTSLTTSAS